MKKLVVLFAVLLSQSVIANAGGVSCICDGSNNLTIISQRDKEHDTYRNYTTSHLSQADCKQDLSTNVMCNNDAPRSGCGCSQALNFWHTKFAQGANLTMYTYRPETEDVIGSVDGDFSFADMQACISAKTTMAACR